MNIYEIRKLMVQMVLLVCVWSDVGNVQAATENFPPQVYIIWPRPDDSLSVDVFLKIKAAATDPDRSIAQVQFFIGTNMIGVATNPPFNILWYAGMDVPIGAPWMLKAVAIDNLGARSESAPVTIYYCILCPPMPIVEMVSPRDGDIFAAPGTFVFSAEVLASLGDAGPIEFFAGTNSLGEAGQQIPLESTTPPTSITVSNLAEGEYKLTVRYLGGNGVYCTCGWKSRTIRVVKLGIQSPRVTATGRLQFDALTSLPGRQTIIQTSFNLSDWTAISTNQPPTNSFTFTESSPATNSHRFYRVVVPTE